MPESVTFGAALLIGLFGSLHCLGMCGGIMGALALAVPPEKRVRAKLLPLILSYNLGRILSYSFAGALFGAFAGVLTDHFGLMGNLLRTLAGLMLMALGLYIANLWNVLSHLERAGTRVWQIIQPLVKQLVPVKTPIHALLVGICWGWIPCGLIYSTLIWASLSGDWRIASLSMLLFGLGTLPAMLATGMVLNSLRSRLDGRGIRTGAGILIFLFGIWTLPATIQLWNKIIPHSNHTHGATMYPHQPAAN